MGMFDNLETENIGVDLAKEEDKVGGSFAKFDKTGLEIAKVVKAYCDVSTGGAYFVDVTFEREDGATTKMREYITSGTAKGCKNYYMVRDKKTGIETGEKAYLPGYNKIKKLDLLLTASSATYPSTSKQDVMIWDKDAKKELPQSKEVVTAWLGKEVGLLGKVVWEDKYGDETKAREFFDIEHFVDAKTKQTLNEKTLNKNGFAKTYCEKFGEEFVKDIREKSKSHNPRAKSTDAEAPLVPSVDVDEDEIPF